MRALIVILGLAANMLFFTYVHAEPFLVQTHNINIVVDCVDEALEAIRGLGGHNLQMDVSTFERPGMNPVRQAEIIRRVDASEYRMAQQLLRSLGTVTFEGESARNIESDISDLRLRIDSATGEFDRISRMMAESDTIQMLITLDSRLSEIAMQRDWLVGSLNMYLAEAGSAVLTIHLAEDMGVFVPPPGPSFGERVSSSFFGSWNVVVRIAEGIAIFVAYAFIPAVLLSILFFPLRLAYRTVTRNREKLRVLAWQRYYAAKDESNATTRVSPAITENASANEYSSEEKSKLLEVQDV